MIVFRPATNSAAVEREILLFLRSRGYSATVEQARDSSARITARIHQPRPVIKVTVVVEEVET